jgi:hypothetical protein
MDGTTIKVSDIRPTYKIYIAVAERKIMRLSGEFGKCGESDSFVLEGLPEGP